MNIYVGNLPLTATDNDLKDIFTEYGEVISAKVITDRETGKSRGFGFVEMGQNAAKKAIDELQDAEFEGRPIVVNEAREKKQGFGGGGNRGGYNRGGGGGGGDRGNSNRSGGGSRGGW